MKLASSKYTATFVRPKGLSRFKAISDSLDEIKNRAIDAKEAYLKSVKINETYLNTLDSNTLTNMRALSKKYGYDANTFISKTNIETLQQFSDKENMSLVDLFSNLLAFEGGTIQTAFQYIHNSNLPDAETIDLGDGYAYSKVQDGTGYLGTFLTPVELLRENVVFFKTDPKELERHAEQIKQNHLASDKYTKQRWNSPHGAVKRILYHDAPRLDDADSETYKIVYEDGTERIANPRNIETIKTLDTNALDPEYLAKQERERENAQRARDAALLAKQKKDKIMEDLKDKISEWLNETSYTVMQKGKILKVLLEKTHYSGSINGILTRVEFVRAAVLQLNLKPTYREENKFKMPNRIRWHNMDNFEQQEFMKKYNSGQVKPIYSIGGYDVTKYEYLYAKFLENKKAQ